MKSTLIIAALLIALPACAPKKKVKYVENPYDNSNNDARLSQLEQRVAALQIAVNSNITLINQNSNEITQLQSHLSGEVSSLLAEISAVKNEVLETGADNLQDKLAELEQELRDLISAEDALLRSRIIALEGSNTSLSDSVVLLQQNLVQLQSSERVVDVIDPCPNSSATYKEVLFKMNSGKLIAYFESGSQRFMTVLLQNVNYQTTDSRACKFYINGNNELKSGQVPVLNVGLTSVSCEAVTNGKCACTVADPNNRPNICTELGLPSSCQVQFGGNNPNQAGYQCANICGSGYYASCVK